MANNLAEEINWVYTFERECAIRDAYAKNLNDIWGGEEKLIGTEIVHLSEGVRADMRTVNKREVITEWEFKLVADYSAIGQILVYMALLKEFYGFKRSVRGIIAAITIPEKIRLAVKINALEVDLVEIPTWLYNAGKPTLVQKTSSKSIHIPLNDERL